MHRRPLPQAFTGTCKRFLHVPVFALLLAAALLLAPSGVLAADDAARADLLIERGAHALRLGDIDAALEGLEAGLALAPAHAGALELYTHALLVAGRAEEAAAALRRLQALDAAPGSLDYLSGLTAYRLGDWQSAREALSAASQRRSGSGVLALLLAVAQQELGEFEAAEASLERALALDAGLAGQVSYRRGIASFRQGRMSAADDAFAEVLDALPDSSLANSALEYRNSISAQSRGRYSASIGIGTGFDSNANLAADSNNAGGNERKSVLGLLELGLGATVYDGDQLRLGLTQLANMRFHNESDDQFDVARSRTGAHAQYAFTPWVSTQLRYSLEQVWSDYHAFRLTNTLEPSLQAQLFGQVRSNAYFRWEAREYDNRVDLIPPRADALDRDGDVYHAGLDHTLPTPEWRFLGAGYFRAGYHFRGENTQGRDYDSEGHELILTLGVALPADLFLTLDLRNEWRAFDQRTAAEAFVAAPPGFTNPTTKNRVDVITRFYLGLRRPFGEHLDVNLGYQHTTRDSRVSFFDYDRDVLEVVATYRF